MLKHAWQSNRIGLVAAALALASCVPGVKKDESHPPIGVSEPGGPTPGGKIGPPPDFSPPIQSAAPARPIIGGTLLALSDRRTAVAADPDRDKVFIADYRKETVLAELALQAGDEPGRVIEDDAGRVHVALRRGGALVTIEKNPWRITGRRAICSAPRGLAFEAATALIHVACAEGELVSLPPQADGAVSRRVTLDSDLRDVLVDGNSLLVSRFRSAEVLTVDRAGKVVARQSLTPRKGTRFQEMTSGNSASGGPVEVTMTPSVAYKMVRLRTGQALMLHQRALADEVQESPGGYSNGFCTGIVESAVSEVGALAFRGAAPTLPSAIVAVDMALAPDGHTLAVVSPGNERTPSGPGQIAVTDTAVVHQQASDCAGDRGPARDPSQPPPDFGPAMNPPDGGAADSGSSDAGGPDADDYDDELGEPQPLHAVAGQAIALSYDLNGHLLVQTREPASIQVVSASRNVILARDSHADTGHEIFHANTGAGIACASCHPEGSDDGRVWKFRNKKGQVEIRRTQNLRGGILATAPFHWNGDLKNLGALMDEVFVTRMSGPKLDDKYVDVLGKWLDTLPAQPKLARDAATVARGRAVYAASGCTSCHDGALLTNNQTSDVGTGGPLQVPSLRGLVWRAPFMHNGCAATLADRFKPECGGGDKHGVTSRLDPAQLADLTAYLETL